MGNCNIVYGGNFCLATVQSYSKNAYTSLSLGLSLLLLCKLKNFIVLEYPLNSSKTKSTLFDIEFILQNLFFPCFNQFRFQRRLLHFSFAFALSFILYNYTQLSSIFKRLYVKYSYVYVLVSIFTVVYFVVLLVFRHG